MSATPSSGRASASVQRCGRLYRSLRRASTMLRPAGGTRRRRWFTEHCWHRWYRTTWNQAIRPDLRAYWFDRSMKLCLDEMRSQVENIRHIVEVRDARIPYCSHPEIDKLCDGPTGCKRMIVFTHGELIPEKDVAKIKANIEDLCNGIEPVMMDLSDREQPRPKTQAIKKELFPFLMSVTSPTTKVPVRAFTVGYPNVGKSTFLYVVTKDTTQEIKKKGLFHRPKIANTPGYTTTLKPHWLSWKPPVRLIDSPGLVPPASEFKKLPDLFYKMALIGCLKEEYVDREYPDILDYLLFRLNASGNTDYVQYFNLAGPTDNFEDLLMSKLDGSVAAAKKRHLEIVTLISQWRQGMFGRIMLDDHSTPICSTTAATSAYHVGSRNTRIR
ncbi:G domain-containing protein [Plasmodiophora brassicae]|uniref:G domain-containing protein n=1 Tax=Plasmodiophora brassicae TaxID=37360 RepID=A0A0G4IM22_PLABS|nr:hypothetical protein PBRA_004899 [Plasmodiophora brassicae]